MSFQKYLYKNLYFPFIEFLCILLKLIPRDVIFQCYFKRRVFPFLFFCLFLVRGEGLAAVGRGVGHRFHMWPGSCPFVYSLSHSERNWRKHDTHLASNLVYLLLAIKLSQNQASDSEMGKIITERPNVFRMASKKGSEWFEGWNFV